MKGAMSKPKARTYVVILKSVGNPDYAQYVPISEPKAIRATSLKAIVKAAQEYIEFWDLGGGNWPETEIRDRDGKSVGFLSYNGRVWDRPWSPGSKPVEINIDKEVARG